MKKALFLLVILAALVGVAVVVQKQQEADLSTASRKGKKVRERLFPDFDWNSIQKIRVKDSTNQVTVGLAGTHWGVNERSDYPSSMDRLRNVISELREQKIASKQEVGKGSWAKIKVQAPGETGDGVGTLVELMDIKGNVLKSFVLGNQVESSGGQNANPMMGNSQRFVRIPEDGETIWVVSNLFSDLDPKPDAWLDKEFIDVQKIKEATFTTPDAAESWKAVRTTDDGEFTLADPKGGEALDAGKVAIATMLSSPSFNDVVAKDKGAEKLKGATQVKFVTFDGFTYEVQVVKLKEGETDKYYLSLTNVTAEIPAARAPVKDEKEEDKKKKDQEFATLKKSHEEKLAKEKKFVGWVYDVSEYTISSLLKKRSEVVGDIKVEPAPTEPSGAPKIPAGLFSPPTAPAGASAAPMVPPTAGNKPISVTTPPVAVPPLPKQEVKPATSPDANPATGEVPAPAAPAPAPKQP